MNYYLHIDQRNSCTTIRDFFGSKMKESLVDHIDACDVIIVGGGDGWMLKAMREFVGSGKILIGVNCGTLGFMLNAWSEYGWKTLRLSDLTQIAVQKVLVQVTCTDGRVVNGFYFNDCVIGNHLLDYCTFDRKCNDDNHYQAKGTGLAISTMLGSTGYSLNLGQPLIPVDAQLRGIAGIATAPFGYQYLAPQSLTIHCEGRHEIMVGLDGRAHTIRNVHSVQFTPCDQGVALGFLPSNHFATKRVLLAQEKMGGK